MKRLFQTAKFQIPNSKFLIRGREEGEDDVKSAWLLRPGLHTCYNGRYNGQRSREMEPIPSKPVSVQIAGCNSPA